LTTDILRGYRLKGLTEFRKSKNQVLPKVETRGNYKREMEQQIRKRINELLQEKNTTLTALCLESNLTPSTIFDFMAGKSHCPKVITIKKLCAGAGITLQEFFAPEYFNETLDCYK
jgi:hypothetical protein